MFSSALKSFTSNIASNYTWSQQPTSTSGPWKIHDAKKKSTGKAASVFIFDRKSLEPVGGSLGGRGNAASLKRAHDEVLQRLKREASSLARLRHPSILELTEPVEETRNGGLMFATEPVTASLAGLLQEKDDQERAGGIGGRSSRYVVEEADGSGRRRRELEIDELEIQKGLLQVGKGLEFLHESAGLVHGNLTPEAVFVNAKSDWKLSGLGFAGPADSSNSTTSVSPISLSEVLNHDPRLPRTVQLDLDYASPDFVLDTNVTTSADMFSLGLLVVALYNSPHRSPLETNQSPSSYKRLFASSSSVPSPTNNFLSTRPLPKDVSSDLLPRLITRRPAQRLNAREFQEAQYFDNILVSTIRFLDALPAKTPDEKMQFMRGLPRVLPQFPKSVLDRKVLPALLEEMKDRALLSLILQNVFAIVRVLPSGKRALSEKVLPRLRETFLAGGSNKVQHSEGDTTKEAGLMVLLENMTIITENSSGKEFKDDVLPIVFIALNSPTHALVDAALTSLPAFLPILDFSTMKNELFPVIAHSFSTTSSLNLKVKGLEAFRTLCGGPTEDASIGDGLDGVGAVGSNKPKQSSSAVLDKFTIQERIVPLLKGIKTKEPAVMMTALSVFKQVGKVADTDFLAMDVLPILWSFSLGPLLNLQQFQQFMALIKSLSSRIEHEQTKKLQEMSGSNTATNGRSNDFMTFGATDISNGTVPATDRSGTDFESLVSGRKPTKATPSNPLDDAWGAPPASRPTTNPRSRSHQPSPETPAFSWSTPSPSPAPPSRQPGGLQPQHPQSSRAITPDQSLTAFAALTPSSPFSQPLQPSRPPTMGSTPTMLHPPSPPQPHSALNWPTTSTNPSSVWPAQRTTSTPALATRTNLSAAPQPRHTSGSAFAIPPPPASTTPAAFSSFKIAPPPVQRVASPAPGQPGGAGIGTEAGPKKGLDRYESLL
ncbi:hypothetical protein BJ546DRAFT_97963 [Cryomyces antarcticus]